MNVSIDKIINNKTGGWRTTKKTAFKNSKICYPKVKWTNRINTWLLRLIHNHIWLLTKPLRNRNCYVQQCKPVARWIAQRCFRNRYGTKGSLPFAIMRRPTYCLVKLIVVSSKPSTRHLYSYTWQPGPEPYLWAWYLKIALRDFLQTVHSNSKNPLTWR